MYSPTMIKKTTTIYSPKFSSSVVNGAIVCARSVQGPEEMLPARAASHDFSPHVTLARLSLQAKRDTRLNNLMVVVN